MLNLLAPPFVLFHYIFSGFISRLSSCHSLLFSQLPTSAGSNILSTYAWRISFNSNVLKKVDATRLQLNFIRLSRVLASKHASIINFIWWVTWYLTVPVTDVWYGVDFNTKGVDRFDMTSKSGQACSLSRCIVVGRKGLSLRSFTTHCRTLSKLTIEDPSGRCWVVRFLSLMK